MKLYCVGSYNRKYYVYEWYSRKKLDERYHYKRDALARAKELNAAELSLEPTPPARDSTQTLGGFVVGQ